MCSNQLGEVIVKPYFQQWDNKKTLQIAVDARNTKDQLSSLQVYLEQIGTNAAQLDMYIGQLETTVEMLNQVCLDTYMSLQNTFDPGTRMGNTVYPLIHTLEKALEAVDESGILAQK